MAMYNVHILPSLRSVCVQMFHNGLQLPITLSELVRHLLHDSTCRGRRFAAASSRGITGLRCVICLSEESQVEQFKFVTVTSVDTGCASKACQGCYTLIDRVVKANKAGSKRYTPLKSTSESPLQMADSTRLRGMEQQTPRQYYSSSSSGSSNSGSSSDSSNSS